MKECRTQPATNSSGKPREIDSSALLGTERRVRILHSGQVYELRETRYGKLILTK